MSASFMMQTFSSIAACREGYDLTGVNHKSSLQRMRFAQAAGESPFQSRLERERSIGNSFSPIASNGRPDDDALLHAGHWSCCMWRSVDHQAREQNTSGSFSFLDGMQIELGVSLRRFLRVQYVRRNAWIAEVLAPVSTLARIGTSQRSGSATNSRQPISVGGAFFLRFFAAVIAGFPRCATRARGCAARLPARPRPASGEHGWFRRRLQAARPSR